MSTRSQIAIEENGKVTSIYCHFDGYLDGVGQTLLDSYSDKEKVEKLIDLGDISSLRENVEIPEGIDHSYQNSDNSITVAYHRDRGEPKSTFETTEKEWIKECSSDIFVEYAYLFKNNLWYIANKHGLTLLKDAIELEKE